MGKSECSSLVSCLKANRVLFHFLCSDKHILSTERRPSSAHLSVHSADTRGASPVPSAREKRWENSGGVHGLMPCLPCQ